MVAGQPLSYWSGRLADADKTVAIEAAGKISKSDTPAAAVEAMKEFAYRKDLSDNERGFAAAMLFKVGGGADKKFTPFLASTQVPPEPVGHEYDVVSIAREALAEIAKTDPKGVVSSMVSLCDKSEDETTFTMNARYFFTKSWPGSFLHLRSLTDAEKEFPVIKQSITLLEGRGTR